MIILRNIPFPLQRVFNHRCKVDERGVWFIYTLLAVITHFTSSRSANLLRCLQTLFGLSLISGNNPKFGLKILSRTNAAFGKLPY